MGLMGILQTGFENRDSAIKVREVFSCERIERRYCIIDWNNFNSIKGIIIWLNMI